MTEYEFESIIERDTDFAIINAFLRNESVRELFLKQIGRKADEILKAYHSLSQRAGESDVVFVLKDSGGTYGIMIEDKINEKPQRKQRERYETRAKELEEQKLFEKHYVFLCAPQAYLESDYAQGYERKVPYESIVDLLDEGLDKAVLAKGIEGGKNGFIKSESVTNYWNRLYKYVEDNYKNNLRMLGTPGDKPAKSLWPTFGTPINRCTIIMKTNNNNVDLEFPGMGKRLYDLELKLSEIGVEAKPVKTGNSASIRYSFNEGDSLIFSDDFDAQVEKLEKWLHKVVVLQELAKKLYDKGMKTIDL